MKIAILTSPKQWFEPFARKLSLKLSAPLFYDYCLIKNFDLVFILSYHKLIPAKNLTQNKHNIVIHASNLPKGKGWSPLFHQVIAGKRKIVFSVFEANKNCDSGRIYLKKTLKLNGLELYEELRVKQAEFTIKLCLEVVKYKKFKKSYKQKGKESFYPKRSPKDSQLDTSKSIDELFNLLRTCSNEEFPAFFYKNGKKFILKIYKASNNKSVSN